MNHQLTMNELEAGLVELGQSPQDNGTFVNLRLGHRITIGTAVLEITDMPHNGCDKFTTRYGHDAIRFVNSPEGRKLRRRGIYARVIQSGTVRMGDTVSKTELDY